jgi:membrane-bound lytic murein transglycosylase B
MIFPRRLALAAIAVAPLALAAKDKPRSLDPSSADATPAPLQYQPAFKMYQPMAKEQEMDHQVWRAANAEVARIGGHASYMKDAPQTASPSTSRPPESESPSATAQPPNKGAKAVPTHHSGHHGMKH